MSPDATHLRLRHLLLVQLLDELGTVGDASKVLNRTQPALTKMLQELESSVGVKLFERGRHGAEITEHGRTFLRRARVILNEWDHLQEDLAEAVLGHSEILRIGTTPLTTLGIVPAALSRFRESWPKVQIRLHEAPMHDLVLGLKTGELDSVVGRYSGERPEGEAGSSFIQERLYDERLAIVSGPAHALATTVPITWTHLAEAEWVMPPSELMTRQLLVTEFLRAGRQPPQPLYETTSFATAIALARSLNVLALVPQDAAAFAERLGLVRILHSALDAFSAPISILRRREELESPAFEAFLAELRAAAIDYEPLAQ
tara:strand:- start:230 stop:1177 length:948 start_codon:yes stop_codon:yes gene_type:complete